MIIIPAIIESISTRKDNTLKVIIGTNEITPDKVGSLMAMHNKMAYVAIKPEIFNKSVCKCRQLRDIYYTKEDTDSDSSKYQHRLFH